MAADGQASRIELPLTPAHIDALRYHVRSERQWYLGAIAFVATFSALLPLLPITGKAPPFWTGLQLVGLVVVLALVADWLFWRRPLAAAIREGVYFRATGSIRTFSTRYGGTVDVGDVTIKYVPFAMYSKMRDLPWGTIDYVPRLHAVLEQRDADGELLYRFSGYRPDADRFDVRPMPSIVVGVLCGVGSCTLVMLGMFALVVWLDSQR